MLNYQEQRHTVQRTQVQTRDLISPTIANTWASLLMNSTVMSNNGYVASAVKQRTTPRLGIAGICTQSPLALSSFFSMENYSAGDSSKTLNLAEITLVGDSEEMQFRTAVRAAVAKSGACIKTATVENPWQDVSTKEKVYKVYVQAVMSPFDFADVMYTSLEDILDRKQTTESST